MSTIFKVVLKLALIIICVFAIIVVAAYLYFNFRTQEPVQPSVQAPDSAESTAPSGGGISMSVEVTEEQAEQLVTEAVMNSMPIENLDISFEGGGSATLSGTISKSDLQQISGDSGIPDVIMLAAQLLPEQMDVTLDFSPTVDRDGNIDIGAQSCTVGGIKIDAKYLPDNLLSSINDRITTYAAENGVSVTDITVQDGKLKLSGDVG